MCPAQRFTPEEHGNDKIRFCTSSAVIHAAFLWIEALIACPAQRFTPEEHANDTKFGFAPPFGEIQTPLPKAGASQSLRFAIMLMTNPPGWPLPVRPGR